MGSLPDSKFIVKEDGYWFVDSHDVDPGKGYITVSAKGIANGLSDKPNDDCDFGPDTYNPNHTGSGIPYTQTSGIQEAINYSTSHEVRLLSGTFNCSNSVSITHNVSLIGEYANIIGGNENLYKGQPAGVIIHITSASINGIEIVPNTTTAISMQLKNMVVNFDASLSATGHGVYSNIGSSSTWAFQNSQIDNVYTVNTDTTHYGFYLDDFIYSKIGTIYSIGAPGVHFGQSSSGIYAPGNTSAEHIYVMGYRTGSITNYIEYNIVNFMVVGFQQTIWSFDGSNYPLPTYEVEFNGANKNTINYMDMEGYSVSDYKLYFKNSSANVIVNSQQNANNQKWYIDGNSTSNWLTTYQAILTEDANTSAVNTYSILGDTASAVWWEGGIAKVINPSIHTASPSISTNPPVSGTAYQNTNPYNILIYLPVYTSTSGTAGNVKASIGATSTPATQVVNDIVNSGTTSSNPRTIQLKVPAGWYYEFTGTTTTFGTAIVVAD